MKRTAEKVLSIISAVFTLLGIIGFFVFAAFMKVALSDGTIRNQMEAEFLADPTLGAEDVDLFFGMIEGFADFSWLFVIVLVISLIATIVGIIFIWNNKNPKLAGAMFILAGLFAFVLSLSSILLYIAGILCFTRKAPLTDETTFVENQYDDTLQPL
jgi:magnesium-transporting ATPase (P-type)